MCRPIAMTDDPTGRITASVTWIPRDWEITLGDREPVFDEEPPLMDNGAPEVQLNNIPLGAGYDLLGRRMPSFQVRKQF